MNIVVRMMLSGAKKEFSPEEYRQIKNEANTLFQKMTAENKDISKALKKHTDMNIFPAIAVYKTLVKHGMEKTAATDVIRRFFYKLCKIMFTPVAWYQHIGGNYHRYPAGMVKNSLRDFSPDAGFEYRMDNLNRLHHKKPEDKKRYAWMLTGAVLCSVFAGLCYKGYKKK